MGVGGQRHALAALPPGKTRYPLYRRLGWPQSWFGWVRKIYPPPGFDPRTVQPVASRYTDYAIPALCTNSYGVKILGNFISTALRTYKLAIHFYLIPKSYRNVILKLSIAISWTGWKEVHGHETRRENGKIRIGSARKSLQRCNFTYRYPFQTWQDLCNIMSLHQVKCSVGHISDSVTGLRHLLLQPF
jgi:hypothetical protein